MTYVGIFSTIPFPNRCLLRQGGIVPSSNISRKYVEAAFPSLVLGARRTVTPGACSLGVSPSQLPPRP